MTTPNARLALMAMTEELARQLRANLLILHCSETADVVLGIELALKEMRHELVTAAIAAQRETAVLS